MSINIQEMVWIILKHSATKNAGAVAHVLNALSESEQKIVRDRFGFDDGKGKTLEEVGADFGFTRENTTNRSKSIEKT